MIGFEKDIAIGIKGAVLSWHDLKPVCLAIEEQLWKDLEVVLS